MKKLFKVSALVLGLGLGVSQGANAAVVPVVDLTNAQYLGVVTTAGVPFYGDDVPSGQSFDNVFTFNLDGSAFTSTVSASYSINSINFTDFGAKLYDVTAQEFINDLGVTDDKVSSWFGSVSSSALSHLYAIEVKGTVGSTGSPGLASYIGNISVSPVPEAEEWAMMMLGVGLITAQLRRKSQKTTTTTITA